MRGGTGKCNLIEIEKRVASLLGRGRGLLAFLAFLGESGQTLRLGDSSAELMDASNKDMCGTVVKGRESVEVELEEVVCNQQGKCRHGGRGRQRVGVKPGGRCPCGDDEASR